MALRQQAGSAFSEFTDLRLAAFLVVEAFLLDTIQHILDSKYPELLDNSPHKTSLSRKKSHHRPCTDKTTFFQRLVRNGGSRTVRHGYTHVDYPRLFRSQKHCTCGPCLENRTRHNNEIARTHRSQTAWLQDPKQYYSQIGTFWRPAMTYDRRQLRVFEKRREEQGANRSNFETENTLGFGSRHVQVGDTIWNIQGAAVAIVLRRSGNHYKVVGECYLHGAEHQNTHQIRKASWRIKLV